MNKLSSFKGSILILIGLVWIVSCSQNEKEIKVITFETTLGPIVIELFEEEAPVTSKNFLEYAESGFFNGTLFHRVIPGFVIQGGGMESGMVNKEGNPPIMNEGNNGIKNLKWTLSMARTNDPHSASSQFFINLVNNVSLDHTEETAKDGDMQFSARLLMALKLLKQLHQQQQVVRVFIKMFPLKKYQLLILK